MSGIIYVTNPTTDKTLSFFVLLSYNQYDKSAMDSQSTTSDVSLSSTMFLLYKSTLSGFSSQFIPLTVLEFSRHVSEVFLIDYIFSLSILLEIIIHHLLFRVCGHMILDVITFIVK
jgi:hypothetical protein